MVTSSLGTTSSCNIVFVDGNDHNDDDEGNLNLRLFQWVNVLCKTVR